jgi:hypothetical protein
VLAILELVTQALVFDVTFSLCWARHQEALCRELNQSVESSIRLTEQVEVEGEVRHRQQTLHVHLW